MVLVEIPAARFHEAMEDAVLAALGFSLIFRFALNHHRSDGSIDDSPDGNSEDQKGHDVPQDGPGVIGHHFTSTNFSKRAFTGPSGVVTGTVISPSSKPGGSSNEIGTSIGSVSA